MNNSSAPTVIKANPFAAKASVAMERAWKFFTRPLALSILAILGAMLLYWRTAYPSVLPGDAGELQFAAWGFWLAHPTGYPLYLLLGGIWQHLLPFGDPAYRLNLFSAFWSGLAIGAAFLVYWNVSRSRGGAMVAALTLAVSPLVWAQATRAEVYALNTFFVAVLSLLGLLWRANAQRKYALAFALVFGLSLTHHRMTILLAPAFAALFAERIFAMRQNPVFFIKRALLYGIIAAIPLALYLYIPLRASATPYATLDLSPASPIVVLENSPRGWLSMILGSGFSGQVRLDATTLQWLGDFPNVLFTQLNPIGAAGALAGFGALLWRRKFDVAAFALYGFFAFVLFSSVYHIGDIADYNAPAYFFACLAFAEGIALLVDSLNTHPFTRGSTLSAIVLLALVALVPMQNLFGNFSAQGHRRDTSTRVAWERFIARPIPENAILVTNDRDEITPLYYLQFVENKRTGWLGLFPKIAAGPDYANVIAVVERAKQSNRPLYALKPIPALAMKYRADENENGLWRIRTEPLPPPQFSSQAVLGETLGVRGWGTLEGDALLGESITLALQYEPLRRMTRDYTFTLQIFDRDNHKVAQGNDHIPGKGEYPSSQWRVGEVLQDRFKVEISPEVPAGEYKLLLRAYDPSDGQELGDLTEIGTLNIQE